MTKDGKVRVHIKNNHASLDTFPPTPEGEAVFTISRERYEAVARRHPDVAERLDVFIDWDLENFHDSMKSAEVLIMTLLGGMGAFYGPAVGALVLLWLNQQIVSYTEYWPLILGSILVVLLFAFPGGLAGGIGAVRRRVARRLADA